MHSYRWKFPLIALIVFGFLSAYLAFGLTLGIDLKGGSVLIYELDLKNVSPAARSPSLTQSTIDILSKRLDTLGMKEMSIRQAGDYQIMIQLPGVSEQSKERIKQVIRKAGQLWFKIVVEPGMPGYDPRTIAEIEERKARGDYVAEDEEFDTARVAKPEKGGEKVLLLMNDDAVDGRKLEGADFTHDAWGGPAVRFYMKPSGRANLANTTEKYVGRRMAIVLDGVAVSSPRIKTAITEGTGIIEGQFTQQEVDDLITVLRSGALPAKPVLVSENTIEPTLGQESIRRGMLAMYGAVAIVALFMFLYYFGAGAIANLALTFNIVILLGIMSLFEATLTLPGIAGIVLTVGMAVDANILIFERIREEKRRGVPITEAVNAGYDHAFSAIFDSNITTILTAGILYYVGTGPIKGFAVTLALGIATSLFTALFVTRAVFEFLIEKGIVTEVRMLRLNERLPQFPFIQKRMPFVIMGLILLNLGYVSFVVRGDEKYGIDFNGGTALQMRFTEPMTKSQVEERLAAIARHTEAGAVVHPYAEAEVSRLGVAENAQGAGRLFQILISSHGREEHFAPEGQTSIVPSDMLAAASADVRPGAPSAQAGAAAEGGEEAESESRLETPQEGLTRDIEREFKGELAPFAFSEPQFEPIAGTPGKGRIVLDVRLAAGATIDPAKLRQTLAEAGFVGAEVTPAESGRSVTVTAGPIDLEQRSLENTEQKLKTVIADKYGDYLSNPFPLKTSIGSSVAESLKYRAILAVVLSLIMIIAYIAFRFEFKMGLAATLCLFHDVLVTLGFMMLLDVTSRWTGIDAKQNLTTIAAYLTIVGYSINDTIVTFDRMRENLAKWTPGHGEPKTYEGVLNLSINQTLGRTILTSLTVFLTLLVLAVAGVKSIQGFTLAMLIGVIFGTFSSIFIATPLLLVHPRRIGLLCLGELLFFIAAGVLGSYANL